MSEGPHDAHIVGEQEGLLRGPAGLPHLVGQRGGGGLSQKSVRCICYSSGYKTLM